ncbi:MAG: hypothetical protein ACTTJS_06680 [Wolinella sp.]
MKSKYKFTQISDEVESAKPNDGVLEGGVKLGYRFSSDHRVYGGVSRVDYREMLTSEGDDRWDDRAKLNGNSFSDKDTSNNIVTTDTMTKIENMKYAATRIYIGYNTNSKECTSLNVG